MHKITNDEAIYEIRRQVQKWFNGTKSGDDAMDNVHDILFRTGILIERVV